MKGKGKNEKNLIILCCFATFGVVYRNSGNDSEGGAQSRKDIKNPKMKVYVKVELFLKAAPKFIFRKQYAWAWDNLLYIWGTYAEQKTAGKSYRSFIL